jgi:hypothetical protein
MHPNATIAAPSAWTPWDEMDYDVLWLGACGRSATAGAKLTRCAGHTHEKSWNEPNGPRPYMSYEDDTLADYEKTQVQICCVFNNYRIALGARRRPSAAGPRRAEGPLPHELADVDAQGRHEDALPRRRRAVV